MSINRTISLLIGLLLIAFSATAQNDSIQQAMQNAQLNLQQKKSAEKSPKLEHSPKTATLLAIVPSAGQAYNRKYWKMPIVYATMGGCIYVVISQQKQFSRFKKAYIQRDAGEIDEFYNKLSKDAILNNMDSKRTIRDYALAGTILFYALQIVDANVDAHLFYFDVGDDLSARIYPQTLTPAYSRTPAFGIGCTINF